MPDVLITVCDGTVDFCRSGDVNVVLIDMDRYNHDRSFPDDVDSDIASLKTLSKDIPWATELMRRLATVKAGIADAIRNEAPPATTTSKGGAPHDDLPGTDAGSEDGPDAGSAHDAV